MDAALICRISHNRITGRALRNAALFFDMQEFISFGAPRKVAERISKIKPLCGVILRIWLEDFCLEGEAAHKEYHLRKLAFMSLV